MFIIFIVVRSHDNIPMSKLSKLFTFNVCSYTLHNAVKHSMWPHPNHPESKAVGVVPWNLFLTNSLGDSDAQQSVRPLVWVINSQLVVEIRLWTGVEI